MCTRETPVLATGKVNDTGFLSERVVLPMIYSWTVSIVLRTFNFSYYIFEEL